MLGVKLHVFNSEDGFDSSLLSKLSERRILPLLRGLGLEIPGDTWGLKPDSAGILQEEGRPWAAGEGYGSAVDHRLFSLL